jgi:choline kinase
VSAEMHESVRANDFPLQSSLKAVNISFVRQAAPLVALREAVKRTITNLGSKAPLEYAMQDLVTWGLQIVAVETGSLRWFEVDTPEDLEIAESLFRPAVEDQDSRASEQPVSP